MLRTKPTVHPFTLSCLLFTYYRCKLVISLFFTRIENQSKSTQHWAQVSSWNVKIGIQWIFIQRYRNSLSLIKKRKKKSKHDGKFPVVKMKYTVYLVTEFEMNLRDINFPGNLDRQNKDRAAKIVFRETWDLFLRLKVFMAKVRCSSSIRLKPPEWDSVHG